MVKVPKVVPPCKDTDYIKFEGRDVWWACEPNAEKILMESETGIANYTEGIPLKTMPEMFAEAVQKHGNRPALRSEMAPPLQPGETPPPSKPLNEWRTWTWEQYYQESRKNAKACIAMGLKAHQSVCIFGFNSPEWCMSMYGAILSGGTAAGIYPTDNEETLRYKADQSDSVVCVVENLQNFNTVKAVADKIPTLNAIVSWGEDPGDDLTLADGRVIRTFTFEQFQKLGEEQSDEELEKRIAEIKPGHACALIYTSGTTGPPKATMISHDSINFAFSAAYKSMKYIGTTDTEERTLSYLPLSHVAGMMLDVIAPVGQTANNAGFRGWMTVNFARPYDLKVGSFAQRLAAVRPTLFFGVPRVWEKFMEKLQSVNATMKGMKKRMANHAYRQAYKKTSSRQLGGKGSAPFMGLANVVIGKIKNKLGLDKCKVFISAAAPQKLETLQFFGTIDMILLEAYGMSESCALATWSSLDSFVWGSCGAEFKGVECKILSPETGEQLPLAKDLFNPQEEEQGEICFRGRSIMIGYMANPRFGQEHIEEIKAKNRAAIDQNGWMHSGDKGCQDVRGMFRITGRYKELIIGAGGENIAPVPIEDAIKEACPIISNVMMVGNKRKFNVMIVTLKAEGATGITPGGDNILPPFDKICKTISEARANPEVIKMIAEAMHKVNKNKSVVVSNAAKIQKFTILPRDFSVITGEFTATQKLIRGKVDDKYQPIIDKMYEVEDEYVNYDLAPITAEE